MLRWVPEQGSREEYNNEVWKESGTGCSIGVYKISEARDGNGF